ncbi:hypothetical protein BS47DRAFT_1374132 [Hydnum rufescens UP504]|uniref:3-ketoacyl-CoA thiolase n=1 Tax=Hydnum rufescens UP504 TaxID=1448309 RepID=A0A9P6AIH2_9AGAM|nr:hypothetical protein BS47DRAFT_1374132 [Hydnum rufescens UP504]
MLRATTYCAPRLQRFFSSPRSKAVEKLLQKNLDDVVITLALRTPLTRGNKGGLKDTSADSLLYGMLKAVQERSGVDPAMVEDITTGVCHSPSPTYEARAAALAAGFPQHVPVQSINRLCSSGLMAVRSISDSISRGDIQVGLAVGYESMSTNPRPTPVFKHPDINANNLSRDCAQPMGWTSENVATDFNISREAMDEYAGTTEEGLAKLKSAFPNWGDGRSTAGNSSPITDGAAAVMLMTRQKAEELGLEILARHVNTVVTGVPPRHMGVGPAFAIPKVLSKTGLSMEDVDLFEINEAFASMMVYTIDKLQVPLDKLNVNGGAIALGHPLGCTGARQIATGLSELKKRDGNVLVTSMCIGSGMGAAAVFVRESTGTTASKL